MLYERDYRLGLTEEEEKQYKDVTGRDFNGKRISGFGTANNPSKYPKAARMCRSLFPNNFLDFIDLRNPDKIKNQNEQFLSLINNRKSTERDVLNFIKDTKSYHIIGSILKGGHYPVGHHGVYLFPEFKLGNTYVIDYLICANGSGGHQFFLIELENIYDKITVKDGDLGHEFRDGISQLKDWKRQIQQSYPSFNEVLRKCKNPNLDLPDEFYSLDLSRFHYIVIAGRRNDFKDLTYTLQRENRKSDDIYILHYDNLYDFSNSLIGEVTY